MAKEKETGPSAGEVFLQEYSALSKARGLKARLESDQPNVVNLAYSELHDFATAHYGLKGENTLSAKQYNLAQKIQQREGELRTYGHVTDNLDAIVEELPEGGLAAIVHGLKPVKIDDKERHSDEHNTIFTKHDQFYEINELNRKFSEGKVSPGDYAKKVAKQKTAKIISKLEDNEYTAGAEDLHKLWKGLTDQIVTYGDAYAQRVGQQLQVESLQDFEVELQKAEEHGYGRADYARNSIANQTDVVANTDQIGAAFAAQEKLNAEAAKKKK